MAEGGDAQDPVSPRKRDFCCPAIWPWPTPRGIAFLHRRVYDCLHEVFDVGSRLPEAVWVTDCTAQSCGRSVRRLAHGLVRVLGWSSPKSTRLGRRARKRWCQRAGRPDARKRRCQRDGRSGRHSGDPGQQPRKWGHCRDDLLCRQRSRRTRDGRRGGQRRRRHVGGWRTGDRWQRHVRGGRTGNRWRPFSLLSAQR